MVAMIGLAFEPRVAHGGWPPVSQITEAPSMFSFPSTPPVSDNDTENESTEHKLSSSFHGDAPTPILSPFGTSKTSMRTPPYWSFKPSQFGIWSDQAKPTTVPTRIPPTPWQSPATSSYGDDAEPTSPSSPQNRGSHPRSLPKILVGVLVVLMLAAVAGGLLLFCLRRQRHRRQSRKAEDGQGEKAKDMPLYPPSTPSTSSSTPLRTLPTVHAMVQQPVILGPIASNSNGAYLTGMDTSEWASMHSGTGAQNPFVDQQPMDEAGPHEKGDPPPPYRPRSVAALSRDMSVRVSSASSSGVVHSGSSDPFADPPIASAGSELDNDSRLR